MAVAAATGGSARVVGTRLARRTGFTIVELLIVIVIIAILATIVLVAYNGARASAIRSAVLSELSQGAKQMEITHVRTGQYPATLPTEVRSSADIVLTLEPSTYDHYSGLSNVQRGVLFELVCDQLISEGYGKGVNNGGQTEQYVTGCNVYGYGAMQINGWNAHDFAVPIAQTTVNNWYDSNIGYDAWRPHHKEDVLAFASELTSRYQAMGGTYPVTSFWDPWASPGNGVMKEELPAPDATNTSSYCLQGVYGGNSTYTWHVGPSGSIAGGPC